MSTNEKTTADTTRHLRASSPGEARAPQLPALLTGQGWDAAGVPPAVVGDAASWSWSPQDEAWEELQRFLAGDLENLGEEHRWIPWEILERDEIDAAIRRLEALAGALATQLLRRGAARLVDTRTGETPAGASWSLTTDKTQEAGR